MLNVECRRCAKELGVPGALAFGVPDKDGCVAKHHICVACWEELLTWLYRDGDMVAHIGSDANECKDDQPV